MNYKRLMTKAIDLHMHIGPEVIPRKFDLQSLIELQRGKLRAVAIKNHFCSTTSFSRPESAEGFVIDSIVLNNTVGGFNAFAIKKAAKAAKRPMIVWFPTISAKNFLKNQKFEIPEEWVGGKLKNNRVASQVNQLCVIGENQKLKPQVIEVLRAIKQYDCILATGHISSGESERLVEEARKIGIKKIIITHPVYQPINMTLKVQKKLADLGCFIEQCYSMYTIDRVPIKKIAKQIKAIGAERCILSSDAGQKFSPAPCEALEDFVQLLKNEGVTDREIMRMLVVNPSRLINIK